MRLLVVSSWLPYPPDNGSRLRAFHLLTHLARRHTITLLSFGSVRNPEDEAALHRLCAGVEIVPRRSLDAKRLGLRGLVSRIPRHLVQTESLHMRSLVASTLREHDVALALQIDAAWHLASSLRNVPAVFDEVEVGVLRDRFLLERSPLKRLRHGATWWKFQHFVRSLVGKFESTTVVSGVEREHLVAMGCEPGRIAVVPNGVDLPVLPARVNRVARLICPGAVTYSANLDAVRYFVHEVLPLVRRSRPDLEFWVTGSTEGVGIGDLASAEGVVFTGQLPDVTQLIMESTACVVPLRVGGGTRLKVLHAMAASTPVVSTSKGIEGLDLEPGRHVLVGDSPASLAQHVLHLASDPDLGQALSSAARRVVEERYTWNSIVSTLEQLIERAVDAKRSTAPA